MMPSEFNALVVTETAEKQFVREVKRRNISDLPAGDLLIEVKYSSLNYKDALSASGNKGVTRSYPHTPGIDAAGVVVQSESGAYHPGDAVIVTGYDLGMNTPGGFGRYIRVPAAWAVALPHGLTLRDAMAYGTAGVTAALCVTRLLEAGLSPDQGEVLVTGATGGVGSVAVGILAKIGFHVTAATGKTDQKDFLARLGARAVISRDEANDGSGRPMLKPRWAGAVDSVGGNILATAIKSAKSGGIITACGNVGGADFTSSIYPFILRGITLIGVDSVEIPAAQRLRAWEKLAGQWQLDTSGELVEECSLQQLSEKINQILKGGICGRVVVNLAG